MLFNKKPKSFKDEFCNHRAMPGQEKGECRIGTGTHCPFAHAKLVFRHFLNLSVLFDVFLLFITTFAPIRNSKVHAGCEASESQKRWFFDKAKTTVFTNLPKSAQKVGPGKSISNPLMRLKKGFFKIHFSNSACSVARAPTSFPPPQNSRKIRTNEHTENPTFSHRLQGCFAQ